ncbi:agamous-like MADS-box protein AGL30 isoform X4 [Populus alba x Populus x berolinensis]|uniref:Agamous-like MADS-box protein AGL30 isoform X4 n=1 Tax=Populus alba x Populus x berolinensis TaxID=444605 RepID=A0AAD6Q8D4_9ROSI|nr:agamous-like MADS-box protein AGL30 isoform X4 [Populus alba x Populus x berolinensis]
MKQAMVAVNSNLFSFPNSQIPPECPSSRPRLFCLRPCLAASSMTSSSLSHTVTPSLTPKSQLCPIIPSLSHTPERDEVPMEPVILLNVICCKKMQLNVLESVLGKFANFWGMGRVKLKIKKLENTNGRQATFAKRKHGIMKKANELSILCDIDIILLMFSPTGKPSLCKGASSSIEEVITKFAQLTPQERAKRKLESLEALKKTFKKLDHDVNIPEFLGTSSQTIEDLTSQSRLLQNQLSDVHKRLSYWTNPDKINSIEHLGQLENSLRESLNQIRSHKENLGKQHLMSLECHTQFQNGMHVPFRMGAEQQLSPLLWMPNNDGQHIMLPEEQNLLPHRDAECTASTSFGSYSGYFGAGKHSELSSSGQESGMNGILDELNGTASLRLQLAGQYPYLPGPYNLNLLNDTKFQPAAEMNIQKCPGDFNASGSFEAPKPDYDTGPHGWASNSGSCAVTMFDDHLYAQGSRRWTSVLDDVLQLR